jgi:tRNA-uridine aminocarboxypropyltransferase
VRDCVCNSLHSVNPGLDIRLLIHNTEFFRQSNTGRIAHLLLQGSQVAMHGAPDRRLDCERLAPSDRTGFILYPSPHAEVATPATFAGIESPYLIVLDGSWSQTRSMYQRNPALHTLRKLTLPESPPARWKARKPPHPSHYCTLEALIHLFEAVGKGSICPDLWSGLELMQDRLLRQRGIRR